MKHLVCVYFIISLLFGTAFHADLYNKQIRECGQVNKEVFSSQEVLATTLVWPVLSLVSLTVDKNPTYSTCSFLEGKGE